MVVMIAGRGFSSKKDFIAHFFSECGTEEVPTGFSWRDMMKTDHFEDLSVDGRIILKWMFKEWELEAWTGLLWFKMGTGSGRL
jgi:hypothetical protein